MAEGDRGRCVGDKGLVPLGNNLSEAEGDKGLWESLLTLLRAGSILRVGDMAPLG